VQLSGKKLAILLSTSPDNTKFEHGLRLAEAAMRGGIEVYLYCIDEAIYGIGDPALQAMKSRGLKLFACAYAARERNLPITDLAAYSGLTIVSDLVSSTDRFVAFN
jgi:sulfur relay (sulfurtransferase) complex TusBCD TusD component (DsrE family)